jgi:hypothetical protein
MALVTCPDCSNQVSDQAPSCPKCGRPMRKAAPGPPPPAGSNGVAALLSFFIPGAGHLYVGDLETAVKFWIAAGVAFGLFLGAGSGSFGGFLALVLAIGIWIVGIVTALNAKPPAVVVPPGFVRCAKCQVLNPKVAPVCKCGAKLVALALFLVFTASAALADEDATWTTVDQPDGSRVTVFDVRGKGGDVEVRTRAGETLRGPHLDAGKRARVTVVERPGAEPVVVIDRSE